MFCLNVLPNVLPKCSADRCADGATTEGTVLAAAPKAFIPRRSLPPFPRFPPWKSWKASWKKWSSWSPKTGPRTGLEKSILNTLEIVEKWSSWSPKTGPRTGLGKIDVEHPGNRGKRGKMELLVTEKQARGTGPSNPNMERLERLGVWCPEVSFFHAFHDFQGVQNRFWNQVPRACSWCPGAPFFHAFHAFHVVRSSLLNPAPRARFWCPGAPFFHAFHVVRSSHLNPAPRGWLFWALPTPPWKPWKAWKWWKRLARQRGRRSRADGFFLWACRGCNNAKRYDATLGPDHGSQRKARRFCLLPERPADPRRAVLPQHHRPVPLAVRQLRDFNRGP